jgi:magnesium-protoporphyrin IX monomethyl ester (oxidative) cyclase
LRHEFDDLPKEYSQLCSFFVEGALFVVASHLCTHPASFVCLLEQPAATSCKPLLRPIHLSIRHSARRSLDFTLSERNGNRVLAMVYNQEATRPVGPEIKLDRLIACSCSISMDKLMSVLFRNEWMRNNPGRITGQLLTILGDREVLRFGRKLAMLFLRR